MSEPTRLGRRVKRLRERSGWSQHELARRSGVSRSTIAGLETGDRPSITLENAMKLADALGVSIDMMARGDILENEILATLA